MTDVNTKVLLYPLERLDLVDLRGVQDLAHNAVSEYIGAVTTSKSGLVTSWSSVTIDTVNHHIAFTDFTALGRTYDSGGNSSYYAAYLLKFSAVDSANEDCSYDAALTSVQAYFNTNGSLPPVPTAAAHTPATHGDYYPYIYCRPVVNSGETEVRRFWSLADAQETTDSVETRSVTSVEFSIVPPSQAPSAGGDYSWIRIAQVSSWVENGGAVELQAVREQHIADRLLHLDDSLTVKEIDASAGAEDGLDRAVKYLQNRIEDLLNNGTDDPALTNNKQNYEPPRLSISGLDYELNRRGEAIEEHLLSATYLVTSTIDAGAGTESVTVSSGFGISPIVVNAQRDYSLALSDYRTGGLTAPIAVSDLTSTLHLAKAAYTLFISIPSSYEGYGLQVTVTPVALVDYTSDMPGISTNHISSGSYLSNTWHILQGSSANSVHKLTSTHEAKDANGDLITLTGFRLVGSCAYRGDIPNPLHLPSASSPIPLVYKLKLDITLVNPITYGGL